MPMLALLSIVEISTLHGSVSECLMSYKFWLLSFGNIVFFFGWRNFSVQNDLIGGGDILTRLGWMRCILLTDAGFSVTRAVEIGVSSSEAGPLASQSCMWRVEMGSGSSLSGSRAF